MAFFFIGMDRSSGFINAEDVILDDAVDATLEVDLAAFRSAGQNDDEQLQVPSHVPLEPIADLIAGLPGDQFVRPSADAFAKLMIEALSSGVVASDDAPALFGIGAYHAMPMRVVANAPVAEDDILHQLSALSNKWDLDHKQRQRAIYKQSAPFSRKTGKAPKRDVTFHNEAMGGIAMVALGATPQYEGDPLLPVGLVPRRNNMDDTDNVFDPNEYLRELRELRRGSKVTVVFNVPVALKGAMISRMNGVVIGTNESSLKVKLADAVRISTCDVECEAADIAYVKVPLDDYAGMLLYPRERSLKPDKMQILSGFRIVLSNPNVSTLRYVLPHNSDEWLTVAVRSMGRQPRSLQDVAKYLDREWGVGLRRTTYNWAARPRSHQDRATKEEVIRSRESFGVEPYIAAFQTQSVSASKEKAVDLQQPTITSAGTKRVVPKESIVYGIALLDEESGKVDTKSVWDDVVGRVVSVGEYTRARTRRLQERALSVAQEVEYLKNPASVGAATAAVRERLEHGLERGWDLQSRHMTYSGEVRRLTRYSGDIAADDPDIGDGAFIVASDDASHAVGLPGTDDDGGLKAYVAKYFVVLDARAPGNEHGVEKAVTVSSFFIERIVRAKCMQLMGARPGAVAGAGAGVAKPSHFWLSPSVYALMLRSGFLHDDVMRELENTAAYIVPATIKLLVSLNELTVGSLRTKDALKHIDGFVARTGVLNAYAEAFRFMQTSHNIVKGLITRTATFMKFVTEFDERSYASPRPATGVGDPKAPRLPKLQQVKQAGAIDRKRQVGQPISHANPMMVNASLSIADADIAALIREFLLANKDSLNGVQVLSHNRSKLHSQVDAAFKQSKLGMELRQSIYRRASAQAAELRTVLCKFLRKVLRMKSVDVLDDMSADLGAAVAMYALAVFKDYKTIAAKLPEAFAEYDAANNHDAIDVRLLELRSSRTVQLRKTAELAGIDPVDARLYEELMGDGGADPAAIDIETVEDDGDVDVVPMVGMEDDDDRGMRAELD